MNGECVSNKRRKRDCCTKDRLCGVSMFLSVCLLFSLVCLAIFSYFLFMRPTESEYCTNSQCIESAAEINEFIDDQIEPCEDFQAFVCNKFMETAYEKQINNPPSAEENRIESKIDKYIIEPESRDDEQPVVMQKRFFRACIGEETIDENNNTDFLSLLNEIGGWPLLKKDDWKQKNRSWMESMVTARRFGLPFDWFLNIDTYDNGYYYYLKISRPESCGTFKESYSTEYTNVIAHIIGDLVGPNVSIKKVFEIVNFERNLSQICTNMRNEVLTKAPIYEIQKNKENIWPENVNSIKFINAITGQTRRWEGEVFYDHYYISKLKLLLNQTDKETQANYIGWKITQYFAPYLTKSIRETYQKYMEEYDDRFQFCLKDTKSRFHLVSEAMYIRENAPEEVVEAGTELVTSVRNEFLEQIKSLQWMNNETKETKLNLYEKMEITVGGTAIVFEENFFTNYLDVGQLSLTPDNIIRMLCDWSKTIFFTKIRRIGKPSTLPYNSEYIESTSLILDENGIYLPVHLLNGPNFELDRPYYLNYASLGTLIARKLVEAIVPTKSVSNDYYQNYIRNLQCLLKGTKTSNYNRDTSLSMVQTNYIYLLSRHIAYSAYQKYVEEHEEELELAGVTYNPNQLFWIRSTMNLCFKKLPNEDDDASSMLEEMYKSSILQSVENSPFFGEDFGCEEDTPMNPADKCSVF